MYELWVDREYVVARALGADEPTAVPNSRQRSRVRISDGRIRPQKSVSPPQSSSNMTTYGKLDGSESLSIGSWKLVPSSLPPRVNDRSYANSAWVST